MKKLIYLEDAIDAIVGMTTMGIEELVNAGNKERFDWIKGLSDSLVKIINLPSVQQEYKWETCFECPLSNGCPKIKGCTNEQAIEYASQIPNDCPLSAEQEWNNHTVACLLAEVFKVCRILDDVLANRPTERDALIVAVRKAFDALEAKQRWIPVVERLPKIGKEVLLSDHNMIVIAEYHGSGDSEGFWLINGFHHYLADVNGCAWMPLPEPYTERRNDG